jgi:hypothetical protein
MGVGERLNPVYNTCSLPEKYVLWEKITSSKIVSEIGANF